MKDKIPYIGDKITEPKILENQELSFINSNQMILFYNTDKKQYFCKDQYGNLYKLVKVEPISHTSKCLCKDCQKMK